MKNVIITGISGQDGSYMIDYLLENTNYNIFGAVRRLSKPNYSNFSQHLNNNRFKIVTLDLSDSQSIDNVVREVNPEGIESEDREFSSKTKTSAWPRFSDLIVVSALTAEFKS